MFFCNRGLLSFKASCIINSLLISTFSLIVPVSTVAKPGRTLAPTLDNYLEARVIRLLNRELPLSQHDVNAICDLLILISTPTPVDTALCIFLVCVPINSSLPCISLFGRRRVIRYLCWSALDNFSFDCHSRWPHTNDTSCTSSTGKLHKSSISLS